MLKGLRKYFSSSYDIDLTLKNKLRFESIHSDNRFNSLESIYKRLKNTDQTLTNYEILEHYLVFSKKIQTNTFSAAELELVSISLLCYFRPELTSTLIRNGLLCIVMSLGDSINFDDILNFIQSRILAKDAEPYGGLPQEEGIKWLREILPESRNAIQDILFEVIKKNQEELDSI
ncbi:MAG TPA: hypothetical protein VHA56_07845 [Mucilaginibacter sp.]|nr:hypothetical protein [Mucilaginibacter sp.]